jgi:pyridoxine/pyridoxamine 5'-phosphate oxidase
MESLGSDRVAARLVESTLCMRDPIHAIQEARERARQLGDPYVDVCFLATASAAGQAEVRAIALRDIDVVQGFALLLSALSPKWQQLTAAPGSLHMLWLTVQRQYRVYGRFEPMEPERLQEYWERKGHASRLLEHYYQTFHPQSHPIASYDTLLQGIDALRQRYPQADAVPLATALRGVYLYPTAIDVWHGSPADRLHDRHLYTRNETGWSSQALVP